jgi:isoleucyl-tRNA synthetase
MPERKFVGKKFPSLFAMEESVLDFWQRDKTYEKSLEQTKNGEVFSFYDGPPFITGIPHYATLLPSIAKDVVPRFQTMKGRFVRRTWGWDVHGLPAENQVEKKLGLKSKKDIQTLGLDKFIEECRQYVSEVSGAWRWYIDHIGRWADIDNAYRTDNLNYMESVMAMFKQLYEQELIYRGRRVSLYCPRCATPLSKFEITMDDGNYKDVEDPAVTVSFRLLNDDVYLLAWTTTPWTLPANLALAVDEKAEYVKVSDGTKQYILAHQALERYQDGSLEVIEYLKGSSLVGESYEPLYTFLPINADKDYKVLPGTFVSMDEGTGIVHIAPGFGEDDTKLGEANGLSMHETLDAEGHFVAEVKPWAGMYYKKANDPITEDLRSRNHMFKEERITHSYPHCYRCQTPLIYKAQVSWYLRLDPIRDQLIATNKDINWVPKHFGPGRFLHNLENAPDWSLSRTRYWGSPIPVWQTEDGEMFVAGSIAELEKLSGQKITDLHRPAIDNVVLTLPSGKKATRVEEVLDCWFESGAMPYAQDHYPFENKQLFERHFPADFIIEYTGQLRGWFYYLHVLSNAFRKSVAFKNVVVTGVLMGNDGRKMSKSYGNYPDPKATIEKYGAEAIRLYFMGSKIMGGEDVAITEDEIREQSRLLNVLHNSYQYFLTYAALHNWEPTSVEKSNLLDRWISTRAEQLVDEIDSNLSSLSLQAATKAIRPFIEDLSTWYIRRNRDRFVAGDKAALQTLYEVLHLLSRAIAPILPFSAEVIFQGLERAEQSVHLQSFPEPNVVGVEENQELLEKMELVRSICSNGNMLRSQAGVSLRQPLAAVRIFGYKELENEPEYQAIITDELNVKAIEFGPVKKSWVKLEDRGKEIGLDTTVTAELAAEGRYRELLRKLQDARKKAGLNVGERVSAKIFAEGNALEIIKQFSNDLTKAASLQDLELLPDNSEELTQLPDEDIWYKFGN